MRLPAILLLPLLAGCDCYEGPDSVVRVENRTLETIRVRYPHEAWFWVVSEESDTVPAGRNRDLDVLADTLDRVGLEVRCRGRWRTYDVRLGTWDREGRLHVEDDDFTPVSPTGSG